MRGNAIVGYGDSLWEEMTGTSWKADAVVVLSVIYAGLLSDVNGIE